MPPFVHFAHELIAQRLPQGHVLHVAPARSSSSAFSTCSKQKLTGQRVLHGRTAFVGNCTCRGYWQRRECMRREGRAVENLPRDIICASERASALAIADVSVSGGCIGETSDDHNSRNRLSVTRFIRCSDTDLPCMWYTHGSLRLYRVTCHLEVSWPCAATALVGGKRTTRLSASEHLRAASIERSTYSHTSPSPPPHGACAPPGSFASYGIT